MRLLNSLTRSASIRNLVPSRKKHSRGDGFPLLKPVEESHVDRSEGHFPPSSRTLSETFSEDTGSISSSGKEQESSIKSPREPARPALVHKTRPGSGKSQTSSNVSIEDRINSTTIADDKLLVSVHPSKKPETLSTHRMSSRRSQRKAGSLSRRSAATKAAGQKLQSQLTSGEEKTSMIEVNSSAVVGEKLANPQVRAPRRRPTNGHSSVRPRRSSRKNMAGKKPTASTPYTEANNGIQKTCNPSTDEYTKPETCNSSAQDPDRRSSPNQSARQATAFPIAGVISHSISTFDNRSSATIREDVDESLEDVATKQSSSHESKTSRSVVPEKLSSRGECSSRKVLDAKETVVAVSLDQSSTNNDGLGHSKTEGGKTEFRSPRKVEMRNVTFSDANTSHTTPSPIKRTPVRGLQRWNSTASFLTPTEVSDVLSSRQPTPFHVPATAMYSSKHKNGISLGDMLNTYDRITSSLHSQSSSCDDDSAFDSFAQEDEENSVSMPQMAEQHIRPTKATAGMQEEDKTKASQEMTTQSIPKSARTNALVDSPQKSVQTLPPKLPFDSPAKTAVAPPRPPRAAIGRPTLHRNASTTALLKGVRTKPSTKMARGRRPGLHRQGSLMADNLQDFFSQYDNIYEKIVEDDSLAGW